MCSGEQDSRHAWEQRLADKDCVTRPLGLLTNHVLRILPPRNVLCDPARARQTETNRHSMSRLLPCVSCSPRIVETKALTARPVAALIFWQCHLLCFLCRPANNVRRRPRFEERCNSRKLLIVAIIWEALLGMMNEELPCPAQDYGVIWRRQLKMIVLRYGQPRTSHGRNRKLLTLTELSQCWAPVCLMNPVSAGMAARVQSSGMIRFSNSGSRWEAKALVAWTTALVRMSPRSVFTRIQPSSPLSETRWTGVWACRFKFPASSRMRSRACTNL